jgi:hypothetical protein
MKLKHPIFRKCKGCKNRFETYLAIQKYCTEICRIEHYEELRKIKIEKRHKLKCKCDMKGCKNISIGLINKKLYCSIHYKEEKKINDSLIRKEKRQAKLQKKIITNERRESKYKWDF